MLAPQNPVSAIIIKANSAKTFNLNGRRRRGPPGGGLAHHTLGAPTPGLEGVVEAEAADVGVGPNSLQPGQLPDRHLCAGLAGSRQLDLRHGLDGLGLTGCELCAGSKCRACVDGVVWRGGVSSQSNGTESN